MMMKTTSRLAVLLVLAGLATTIGAQDEVKDKVPGEFDHLKGLPEFRKKLNLVRPIYRAESSSVDFKCAFRAYPQAEMIWMKDGNLVIEQAGKYIFKGYKLKINSLTLEDSGGYTCIVRNEYGSVNRTYRLDVQNEAKDKAPELEGPPKFKRRLNLVPLIFGIASSSKDFKCNVTAYPPAMINWTKDGNPVTEQAGKYILHDYMLTVKSLTLEDSGYYTCIVSNEYGSVNWTYRLDVQQRAAMAPVMEDINNQTAYLGDNVTFTCVLVLSDSPPLLKWLKHFKKNGSFMNENGHPYVKVLQSSGFKSPFYKKNSQHLVLRNVTKEDQGWYSCLIANSVGMNYRSTWLTVLNETEDEALRDLEKDNVISASKTNENEKDPRQMIIFTGTGSAGFAALVIIVSVALVCKIRKKLKYKYVDVRRVLVSLQPNDTYIPVNPTADPRGSPTAGPSDHPTVQRIPFPEVRIEGTGRRRRISPNHTATYEYEFPVDERWEFPRNRLTLGRVIGAGAFGVVLAGEAVGINNRQGSTKVAVKMLKQDATDQEIKDLTTEMEMMKIMQGNTNIVNLLGCCTKSGPLYVITEFAPNGNLKEFLQSRRPPADNEQNPMDNDNQPTQNERLTKQDLLSFAYQVARGMEYMASKLCIHRDLAARNILVAENNVLKIADFGLTRNISEVDYYRKLENGRLPVKWMAPEALFDRRYTIKSDVWTYGVLLWEIFSLGGTPYPSVPVENLFQLLQNGHRMTKPRYAPPEIYQIMLSCWNDSPALRPQFTDLVKAIDRIISTTADGQEYLDLQTNQNALMSTSDGQYLSMSQSRDTSDTIVQPNECALTSDSKNVFVSSTTNIENYINKMLVQLYERALIITTDNQNTSMACSSANTEDDISHETVQLYETANSESDVYSADI